MVLKKQADVSFTPDSAFSSLMTLSKLLTFSASQFILLANGDNTIHLIWLLLGLN